MDSYRLDWTVKKTASSILDLSNNVCFDKVFIDRVTDILPNNIITSYPDDYIAYNSLSEYHSVDIRNICIGFGIGELIQRIYHEYRNYKIAVVSPGWIPSSLFLKTNGINYVETQNLIVDADILYLANPNGVTGNFISKHNILDILPRYKLVIIDEAYTDFCKEDISFLYESVKYDNIIVLKTFSKTISSPGLRFGYCISNNKIIKKLQEKRPAYVSTTALNFMIDYLIKEIPEHITRMLETREYIESKYNVVKSHGNFVLFKDNPNLNCKMKLTEQGLYRMSLTDISTFKRLENGKCS